MYVIMDLKAINWKPTVISVIQLRGELTVNCSCIKFVRISFSLCIHFIIRRNPYMLVKQARCY